MNKKDKEIFLDSVYDFMVQQTELNQTFLNLFKDLQKVVFNNGEIDDVVKNIEKSSLTIDFILDKINKLGIESLTDEEKKILNKNY